MNFLARATIKDCLQVRIPGNGSPTFAFFATIETGVPAACTSLAVQIVPADRSSVVAKNATTWAGKNPPWVCAKHPVVKPYLTTGQVGNRQGLLESSLAIVEQGRNRARETCDAS